MEGLENKPSFSEAQGVYEAQMSRREEQRLELCSEKNHPGTGLRVKQNREQCHLRRELEEMGQKKEGLNWSCASGLQKSGGP